MKRLQAGFFGCKQKILTEVIQTKRECFESIQDLTESTGRLEKKI